MYLAVDAGELECGIQHWWHAAGGTRVHLWPRMKPRPVETSPGLGKEQGASALFWAVLLCYR